jgi:uncharacterized damage-inducible protein DinB
VIKIDESSRAAPLLSGPERAQLESWLDFYRATLILKCAGLSVEQLSTRPVATSDLTLLGLLRHMTFVEQVWFEKVFAGLAIDDYYKRDDDRDADFHELTSSPLDDVVQLFYTACSTSRALSSGHELDEMALVAGRGRQVDLRWIYVHMIEEYARHCGHADLLRELIDGSTGY